MKTPTIFQWYQILRRRYQFTVFQAVRSALWLARGTSSDSKRLCGIDAANQPLIESAQDRSDAGSRSGMNSPHLSPQRELDRNCDASLPEEISSGKLLSMLFTRRKFFGLVPRYPSIQFCCGARNVRVHDLQIRARCC